MSLDYETREELDAVRYQALLARRRANDAFLISLTAMIAALVAVYLVLGP